MNTELILDGAYKIPKAKIYAAEMDAEVRRAVDVYKRQSW